MTSGCAHPGRVWAPGRSAGRSDSCASKGPPSLAWPDNWQPRGIPCGPISSRVCKPHLMTPPVFSGVRVLGVDEHVWHHQDRRRRGPRELTGIVDHSRGGSSHGKVVGPGPRQVWHRVQELARRARRTVSLRYPDRDAGSLPGTARTPSTTSSKTPPASWMPSISSSSLATPQVRCVAASSKTRPVTAGARGIPSIRSAIFCAPRATGSPRANKNASVRPSRQMR